MRPKKGKLTKNNIYHVMHGFGRGDYAPIRPWPVTLMLPQHMRLIFLTILTFLLLRILLQIFHIASKPSLRALILALVDYNHPHSLTSYNVLAQINESHFFFTPICQRTNLSPGGLQQTLENGSGFIGMADTHPSAGSTSIKWLI
jgi:hypothetical protein